jgi:hypothetical protein
LASDAAWLSTKALSVYNVLLRAPAPLPRDAVLSALQEWRSEIGGEYVEFGASYLITKGFVVESNGCLGSKQPGRRLRRVNNDIDLDWA